ncbi:MAG TPA: carbon-nitrogen hydrolase family protein [Methanomassiliicoccales archaeon]|nr:carbon-nitrogen hydrolase family protein [Methanomassiliicoccales archaeon]
MRLALCQLRSALGDKESNLERMRLAVEETDADLFLFPEMGVTGYMVRDRFMTLAEDIDGESVSYLGELSDRTGKAMVFGMPLNDSEYPGLVTNSAVMVTPDGRVQRYDKMHPANFGPFEEGLYFKPGKIPEMFQFRGKGVGVCICYDIFFPEICKAYAMQGADLLLCLSASPMTSRSSFERLIPARAVENTYPVAYVNNVGAQLNMVFFGGSQAYDARGRLLGKLPYLREAVAVVDIDSQQTTVARRSRPTIRDTHLG